MLAVRVFFSLVQAVTDRMPVIAPLDSEQSMPTSMKGIPIRATFAHELLHLAASMLRNTSSFVLIPRRWPRLWRRDANDAATHFSVFGAK